MKNLHLSAVLLSALISSASGALVAQYGFEEGTGTTTANSAGASFTGTLTGATASFSSSSAVGSYSMQFTGTTGRVSLGNDIGILNGAAGVTLATWINAANITGTQHVVHIATGSGNASQARALIRTNSGGIQVGGRSLDSDSSAQLISTPFASLGITANQWFHVATTLDYANDTIRLYINGIEVNSTTSAAFGGDAASDTNSFRAGIGIGFNSDGGVNSGNRFIGLVDDVRIYSHVLSASEVAALVPEPSSLALTALGGIALLRRRR